MKIILSVFILILSCSNFHREVEKGQKERRVLCEAFLLGSEKVKLFDDINGKEVGDIQNDYKEENFYSVKIYEQKKQWFRIRAESIKDTLSGWLHNKSYLATYSRNYTDTLFVYREANKKNLICSIPEYFTSPMEITEFDKDWVKVKINQEGLTCDGGWILQSMTCSSPYTTCN